MELKKLFVAVRWIVALMIGVVALGALVDSNEVGALITLLGAAIVAPPIADRLAEVVPALAGTARQVGLGLVLMVVGVMASTWTGGDTRREEIEAPASPRSQARTERPKAKKAKAAAFQCESGSPASGVKVNVKGSGHELRSAPSGSADRLINQKATKILGSTEYHSIDSSTEVQIQCESGDWVRVQVTKPEWLTHVRGWVKRDVLSVPRARGEARTFVVDDIYWDDKTRPYQVLIVKALNRIHREDPRCRTDIDPGTVARAASKGDSANPVFFVTCGSGAGVVNVFFNEKDVLSSESFKAPPHINHASAIDLCEAYAKQNATHPSTVSFSRVLDLAVFDHANGNTTVNSSFTARNAMNLELKFSIRCLLDSGGLIEGHIVESSE